MIAILAEYYNKMPINHNTFLSWAINKFGNENIKIRKDEIMTHSPFTEDHKFHLYMNPVKYPKGAYRCWYTDKKGSLVALVAELDHISYNQAQELLTGTTSLHNLEEQIHNLFSEKKEEPSSDISLPQDSYLIDYAPKAWQEVACQYLSTRKLPSTNLYICTRGNYNNRIIIPYYDKDRNLVFFNARTINDNNIRYLKSPGNQTKVLYCPKWPLRTSKVYITEGEFDSLSLHLCGFYSMALGGKTLSDFQIEMVREYIPVLAFDNDNKGYEATLENGQKLLAAGFSEVNYIRPPVGFKDWNSLLQEKSVEIILKYIKKFEKKFEVISLKLAIL